MRLVEMRFRGIRLRIAWPFFLQQESKDRTSVRRERRTKITQSEIVRLFAEDLYAHR